jgi:riboflavin biosynthesis pyrimidine reductase
VGIRRDAAQLHRDRDGNAGVSSLSLAVTDRAQRARGEWRERFEAFASRKTRDASAAVLPPYTTEVDRPPADVARLDDPWAVRLFDGPFYLSRQRDDRYPACSLVFVQSAEGNTVVDDPGSLGGGATDKHLIYEGLSRVAADAVFAGAETIRGAEIMFSVWRPELVMLRESLGLPRHPRQVVATRRGVDMDATLLFNIPAVPAIVVTTDKGHSAMRDHLSARPWVTAVVSDGARNLGHAFEDLCRFGIRRLSCVGGRVLAQQLIDASLVDDLYVTTSPQPGGEPDTPVHPGPLGGRLVVRKRGTGPEAGVVFEHWQLH